MRFLLSWNALLRYFSKVGMTANSDSFPNPGTAAAVNTVIDYQGRTQYYEQVQGTAFLKLSDYALFEDEFFDDFLWAGEPFHFYEIVAAMTEPNVDQNKIKRLWSEVVRRSGGKSS